MKIFNPKKPYKMEGYKTLGDAQAGIISKRLHEACKECLDLLCDTDYNHDIETDRWTIRKDFFPQAMDMIAKLKDIIADYEDEREG